MEGTPAPSEVEVEWRNVKEEAGASLLPAAVAEKKEVESGFPTPPGSGALKAQTLETLPIIDELLPLETQSEGLNEGKKERGTKEIPMLSTVLVTHPDDLFSSLQADLNKPLPNSPTQTSPPYSVASNVSEVAKEESKSVEDRKISIISPSAVRIPAAGLAAERPSLNSRTISTPVLRRKQSSNRNPDTVQNSTAKQKPLPLSPLNTEGFTSTIQVRHGGTLPSPMPAAIPMPPLTLPVFLQLELNPDKAHPTYIHRSSAHDTPYEPSYVKIERLLNFLLLPPQLEQVLWFGALACLDSWLYTFTILPLRFLKSLYMLGMHLLKELFFIASFVTIGVRRLWERRRWGQDSTASEPPTPAVENFEKRDINSQMHSQENGSANHPKSVPSKRTHTRNHRRTKSAPSSLLPSHKADILQGFLILSSCTILMYFDASMMYHSIRGQAAIKLYVIYNVLEVFDRLLAALGQDVMECLLAKETLERKANGRSKVLRPFWLFILALFYNILHATALFYQVITLNVAVNSYSNALLTLLMSNQFVEIKSTVFKKFEKESLFQLTCADVVERFQLWLMLIIIASRNMVETNSLVGSPSPQPGSGASANLSLLPFNFDIFPDWLGQVLIPFIFVLGTEMLVDWVKHAYIAKFNNIKPNIYGRFLDVLAKDYYSNAFGQQNLSKRLGLPVIPLSCLFIRASVQTYQMFLATALPVTYPSPVTSLSPDSPVTSPSTIAALAHIDSLFRRALHGNPGLYSPIMDIPIIGPINTDTFLAHFSTLIIFLLGFLVLLTAKLVLGMILLSYARRRYMGMKKREHESSHQEGRRIGGWGVVELDEDKRRWIYEDDPEGAERLRRRERDAAEREKRATGGGFEKVERYTMVGKRIW